ncbi:hypothetical protein [Mesorhizobium sp. 128a]
MTGCGTDKAKLLGDAYTDKAKVDVAKEVTAAAEKIVQEARRMPVYPAQCRRHGHTGVALNDWYDVANQKADNAMGEINKQIDWCAAWYDRNQKAREPK